MFKKCTIISHLLFQSVNQKSASGSLNGKLQIKNSKLSLSLNSQFLTLNSIKPCQKEEIET